MTKVDRHGPRRRWSLIAALTLAIVAPASHADARPRAAKVAAAKPARPSKARAKKARPAAPPVMVSIAGETPAPHDLAHATTPAERAAAKIEALFTGPLRAGTTSILVADAASGAPIFELDPDRPLNPASNVKLLSTAAALDLLGPDHRYTTRILGAPADDAGVIHGGIYLRGTYDPTLDAGDVRALGRALADRGVTRIEGDVVIGDIPTRDGIYRAGVGVDIRAGAMGKPAIARLPAAYAGYDLVEVDVSETKTRKRRGDLKFRQSIVTDDAGHTRVRLTVTGPIGRGRSTTRWIAFDSLRAHHTAHVLRGALKEAGVVLDGDVRVASLEAFVAEHGAGARLPVVLAEHASAPLAHILSLINKRSINWLADRVIMTAAAIRDRAAPSMDRAVDAMQAWLARRGDPGPTPVVVDTGSGLSRRTQFSARHIVDVLRRAGGFSRTAAADAAAARAYLDSLAVAGVDGTLRHRFARGEARGRLRGKTGTLRDSIALSGLLEVDPARPLAFAIVTNGHPSRAKLDIRRAHETLIAAVCEYLQATGGTTELDVDLGDEPTAAPVAEPSDPAQEDEELGLEPGGDAADDAAA
ncbi:MAG: D-alanyl-D-alanine carboxypeptidase/D-alanyl-D-alanine-endopeptidase [Kofleriaceae bacterium]